MRSPTEPLISPWDSHNQTLVSNVHPPNWENPQPAPRYNLVVIGGGTAGLVTAAGAAGLGAKVALVEKHLLGGDCLNAGCVPSKALLRAARAYADVRDAGDYGVSVPTGVSVDFPKVMERMRRLRAQISPNDSAQRFQKMGVDVFIGAGKFTSPHTVEVDGKILRFAKAVIATGGRAAAPPVPGLSEIGYLTNENVFSLTELPKRLGVIGAGPIGCELAQAFARFGAEVFLVEAEHGILPREDRDAAAIVQRSLEGDGIKLLCCGKDLKLGKAGGGIRMTTESHGKGYDLLVDQLLVAVGRAPNVEGLGLETAGVEISKRGVTVNDRLQTTNPRVYACGDVCSPYQFTHMADATARIVIQNALFLGRKRISRLTVPWCTYTDPEVAHVGLYEEQAKQKEIDVRTIVQTFHEVDRAILEGDPDGMVKVHAQARTGKILGATIVARHAGDMISEITLAMTGGVGLGTLANVIHPYPTEAEAIKRAGDAWNRTRLTPKVKNLFTRWLNWTR